MEESRVETFKTPSSISQDNTREYRCPKITYEKTRKSQINSCTHSGCSQDQQSPGGTGRTPRCSPHCRNNPVDIPPWTLRTPPRAATPPVGLRRHCTGSGTSGLALGTWSWSAAATAPVWAVKGREGRGGELERGHWTLNNLNKSLHVKTIPLTEMNSLLWSAGVTIQCTGSVRGYSVQ